MSSVYFFHNRLLDFSLEENLLRRAVLSKNFNYDDEINFGKSTFIKKIYHEEDAQHLNFTLRTRWIIVISMSACGEHTSMFPSRTTCFFEPEKRGEASTCS